MSAFCGECSPELRACYTFPITEEAAARLAALGVVCLHPRVEVPAPGDPGTGYPLCGLPSTLVEAMDAHGSSGPDPEATAAGILAGSIDATPLLGSAGSHPE